MACLTLKKILKTALKSSSRGFTVMELVIVLIVSSVVVISVTPFFKTNINAYMTARAGKDMLQQSRIGFNRMVAEIRRITQFGLLNLSSQQLEFWYRRADGIVPGGSIKYSYDRDKGQILRNNVRLMEGVSAFTITGYTRTGATTSVETNVWRIRISMTIGLDDPECTMVEEVVPLGFIIRSF